MDSAKKRKAIYRQVLLKTVNGLAVLDNFLAYHCMYHGRHSEAQQLTDEEIYVRQEVGRELLRILDLIPDVKTMAGRSKPQGFTAKLLNVKDENDGRGRRRSSD